MDFIPNEQVEMKIIKALDRIEDKSRFEISACGAGFGLEDQDDFFKGLQEAGFNLVTHGNERYLNRAANCGIKVFLATPEVQPDLEAPLNVEALKPKFKECYERVKNHPAFAGFALRDEPSLRNFEKLAKLKTMIREVDAQHECYINLFPCAASPEQWGTKTYTEYVEKFLEMVKPECLGYDLYVLHLRDPNLVPDFYWENFSIIRRYSMLAGINFRYILLSVSHFEYRLPTRSDLNFQAFAALAYGAKSLEYFTYGTPDIGNYHSGPLDQFGCKTPIWYDVAFVNKKIQVLAPVLNRLISTKVYHFSVTGRVPAGMEPPADAIVTENPGKEILVGEFIHADTDECYIMLVNKDLYTPTPITLKLRNPDDWRVKRLSPYRSGVEYDFAGEQLWIDNGGEQLLKLERK